MGGKLDDYPITKTLFIRFLYGRFTQRGKL